MATAQEHNGPDQTDQSMRAINAYRVMVGTDAGRMDLLWPPAEWLARVMPPTTAGPSGRWRPTLPPRA